jgi:hypothetical protein
MVTDHRIIGDFLGTLFEQVHRLGVVLGSEVDPPQRISDLRIIWVSLLRSLGIRQCRREIATILGVVPGEIVQRRHKFGINFERLLIILVGFLAITFGIVNHSSRGVPRYQLGIALQEFLVERKRLIIGFFPDIQAG